MSDTLEIERLRADVANLKLQVEFYKAAAQPYTDELHKACGGLAQELERWRLEAVAREELPVEKAAKWDRFQNWLTEEQNREWLAE